MHYPFLSRVLSIWSAFAIFFYCVVIRQLNKTLKNEVKINEDYGCVDMGSENKHKDHDNDVNIKLESLYFQVLSF